MKLKIVSYHAIGILLIVGSMVIGGLCLIDSYVKFGNSVVSFGNSIAYYFCVMFGVPTEISPTVNVLPSGTVSEILPSTPSGFAERWARFCDLFVSADNFQGYNQTIGNGIFTFSMVVTCAIPLVILSSVLLNLMTKTENNDYGKETRPLKIFRKITVKYVMPIVRYIQTLFQFFRYYGIYWKLLIVIWVFNLNLATIVVGFLAFYFYFAITFDFVSIYTNLVRLFSDSKVFFSVMPWWGYVLVLLVVINICCKAYARDYLKHMELRNKGFINSLPIVSMIVGTMGLGKTTLLTDMTLSQQAIFRDKAYTMMLECDSKFANFPWQIFELELIEEIEAKRIKNLATMRRYIYRKKTAFNKQPTTDNCFTYDIDKYPMDYDDKKGIIPLWEVLEIYAQLFFIYIISSSLIVSNYSIRDDARLKDKGNLPLWDSDFIKRESIDVEKRSRYSHILDFDIMRLGKKVKENNPRSDSFDFGVITITEAGKERGNSVENSGKRKTDASTNQLNDGFNKWIKLCRHPATVDNYPFVKVFFDEQRPESLGADARELCQLVHIRAASDKKNALPFFFIEDFLYKLIYTRLIKIYESHRYRRGDMTLSAHLAHILATAIHNRYSRLYNLYGYKVLTLEVEDGTQDGKYKESSYYLAFKKIYSKRFDTACFGDIFAKRSVKTSGDILRYPEYKQLRANTNELKSQNSHFINDIFREDNNHD